VKAKKDRKQKREKAKKRESIKERKQKRERAKKRESKKDRKMKVITCECPEGPGRTASLEFFMDFIHQGDVDRSGAYNLLRGCRPIRGFNLIGGCRQISCFQLIKGM
jgi:hypothetical protein